MYVIVFHSLLVVLWVFSFFFFILIKMSLAFDRLVAVLLTRQCTLVVVWGEAVIWAAVVLDHTIDVSHILYFDCSILAMIILSFSLHIPSCLFYVGDIFLPKKNAILLSKKTVNGGSGTIWSQVICLWNRLNMKKRLL